MALVSSRRTPSAANDNGRRSKNANYPIKRRSMSAASTVLLSGKRPRTSWGKPHSNPAVLRWSPLFPEEATASSSSATDEDYVGSTVSSCTTVASPGQAASFVKTEPLQHLAIKLKEENYDDGPLHQVPSTLFPAEHLLSTATHAAMRHELHQLSRCLHTFHPLPSLTWPASPHSSSSPPCSTSTVESSGDDMLNWDHDLYEGSCDLLSERFYEIERNMSSVTDETLHMPSMYPKAPSQPHEKSSESKCVHGQSLTETVLVPKMEEGTECSQFSEITSCTASLAGTDTATTTSTTAGGCEEDYRINLEDFELEEGDGEEDGPKLQQLVGALASYQKLALALNYEEVVRAWSDKGSLFTDGSWGSISPDVFALDLAAWEGEIQDPESLHDLSSGGGKMIAVAGPDDGRGGCEDAGSGGSWVARRARVLRYREKRQTRLFAKKIRYEVRKLNAERRPRMKGRFIKRSLD